MRDFDKRIQSGPSYQPIDAGASQAAGAQKPTAKKIEGAPQDAPISTLEYKESKRSTDTKPDASKPTLDKPKLPDNMSTQELNDLLTSANTKLTEGDPQVTETLLTSEEDGGQTIEEQDAAFYQRINDNTYLKSFRMKVSDKGVTVPDETTGEPRPLDGSKPNDRMLQQILLAILLQDVKDKRAEAAGERQKFLQDQVANQIMQSIAKQTEVDKAGGSSTDAGKAGNIIGWIGAILTIVVGVLTVNPGLVIAGLFATTMMALSTTGVMEKMTTAFAKSLEQSGMSQQASQIFASVFIMVVITGITIAATFGAGASSKLATLAEDISKTVGLTKEFIDNGSKIAKVGTIIVTAAQGSAQTAASAYQYEAGKKQAESTTFEANAQDLDFNIQQMIGFYKEIITGGGGGVLKLFSKEMQSQYTTLGGVYGNIA